MGLLNFDHILQRARKKDSRRIVVAAAEDLHVLQAVIRARAEKIIRPVLVGDTAKIFSLSRENKLNLEDIPMLEEKDPDRACSLAVELVRSGEAEILMKGLVPTAPLLKAVLDRENGLRKSELLSHLALFEIPAYHKLLSVTDAAMNVSPDVHEKKWIIDNAVEIFHRLGVPEPRVAVLCPVETVNSKIQSTLDAEEIRRLYESGRIKGCIVDGPLALDVAVSAEAAKHKGIESEVAGDADILLVPDLNSGNILYKSLIFLGDSVSAAVVTGAQVPIVLTSRADSEQSKWMSIALASALD